MTNPHPTENERRRVCFLVNYSAPGGTELGS